MSERNQPCSWCKGRGCLPGVEDCGLCGGTGMIGYSIGDYPYRRPEWKKRNRPTREEVMEQVVSSFEKKKMEMRNE